MAHERDRRAAAVRAEHEQALARGEQRVLCTTAAGDLHSYPDEEIGFTPGSGHPQVSTWWGMGILTVVMGLLFVLSWFILLAPTASEDRPYWPATFLVALSGLLGWYTYALARDEYLASRLRRERGAPRPGSSGSLPPH
jgi:hypothetical protein